MLNITLKLRCIDPDVSKQTIPLELSGIVYSLSEKPTLIAACVHVEYVHVYVWDVCVCVECVCGCEMCVCGECMCVGCMHVECVCVHICGMCDVCIDVRTVAIIHDNYFQR